MPARLHRWIAEQNVRHWRELLENETDAAQREMLARLIEEEEAKLKQSLEEAHFCSSLTEQKSLARCQWRRKSIDGLLTVASAIIRST